MIVVYQVVVVGGGGGGIGGLCCVVVVVVDVVVCSSAPVLVAAVALCVCGKVRLVCGWMDGWMGRDGGRVCQFAFALLPALFGQRTTQ